MVSDLIVGPNLRDASGQIAEGAVALVADSCLGLAVAFQGGPARSIATSYLHIEYAGPVPHQTAAFHGTGHLRGVNGTIALAEGTITEDCGSPVAYATMGAVVTAHGVRNDQLSSSTEATTAHRISARADDTVDSLLGTHATRNDGDAAVARFCSSPALANALGGLHGGVGMLMGAHTCRMLLGDAVAHLVALRAAFTRPVPADGGTISCRAGWLHRGRRAAHIRAELSDQAGRFAVAIDAVYAPT